MSNVIVPDGVFDAEHIRENPGAYAAKLQRAKVDRKFALCDCSNPRLRLQIRELNGFFYLAVWPNEGPKHKVNDCYFYRDEVQQEAENAARRNSIIEHDDGMTTIKPDFAMSVGTSDSKTPTASLGEPENRMSRRRASLLAILIHLWSASRNNQWFGGPRTYSHVVWHLWLQMRRTKLGNESMTQACMLPGIRDQPAAAFMLGLTKPAKNAKVQTAMLIGRILSVNKTEFGHRLALQYTNMNVYMSEAIHLNLVRRFCFAMRSIGDQNGFCVMLAAHFEAKYGKSGGTPYINLIDASLFVTTAHFIPVDSSYERRLSDDLVNNGRKFIKPLAVEEGLMPDFILLDTPKPVYLEVWGMDSPEYLTRKQEKLQTYKSRGMQLWEWDAQRESNPPPLPS